MLSSFGYLKSVNEKCVDFTLFKFFCVVCMSYKNFELAYKLVFFFYRPSEVDSEDMISLSTPDSDSSEEEGLLLTQLNKELSITSV